MRNNVTLLRHHQSILQRRTAPRAFGAAHERRGARRLRRRPQDAHAAAAAAAAQRRQGRPAAHRAVAGPGRRQGVRRAHPACPMRAAGVSIGCLTGARLMRALVCRRAQHARGWAWLPQYAQRCCSTHQRERDQRRPREAADRTARAVPMTRLWASRRLPPGMPALRPRRAARRCSAGLCLDVARRARVRRAPPPAGEGHGRAAPAAQGAALGQDPRAAGRHGVVAGRRPPAQAGLRPPGEPVPGARGPRPATLPYPPATPSMRAQATARLGSRPSHALLPHVM